MGSQIVFIIRLIILLLINVNISKSSKESLLASQHFNRILKEAKCRFPVPRVVHIKDLFPSAVSATKKYIPHCTVLYSCGQFSGCCRQESEQCETNITQQIDLYFRVIELTSDGKQKKSIERLSLKNDTECHCVPINKNNNKH